MKIRSILGGYVSGQSEFATDDEARKVLIEVIDLTNFLNWRDKSYLTDQLLAAEGDWLQLGNLVLGCLRHASSGWESPLQKMLDWLIDRKCWFYVTKILPTYFLFLWEPTDHFYVKSRFTDNFLRLLGEKPLGQGKSLTIDLYKHVLNVCQDFRRAIADWKPSDNIDVHEHEYEHEYETSTSRVRARPNTRTRGYRLP